MALKIATTLAHCFIAFFSFLRANLVLLPASTLNSNASTPLLDPYSSQALPPLQPSSLATMTSNAEDEASLPPNSLDSIPTLTTAILTSEADKVAALKLVADSIAQQRQLASVAIIYHPVIIAAYIFLLAITSLFIYKTTSDILIMVTTCAGITMALLVVVQGWTSGYVQLAEEFNWKFMKNQDGEEDIIIGSRYGEQLIGALILRLERNGNGNGRKKSKGGKTGGRGIVRAWTTKQRYRGTGVGTELLEEAVRVTRERLGNSAEIGFAAEHANSKMLLPEMFNRGFREREARAARALEEVIGIMDAGSKKKR
jgi:GNAT superfamily N-acetyltransferase